MVELEKFLLHGKLIKRTNRWCKLLSIDSFNRVRIVRVSRVHAVIYPGKFEVGNDIILEVSKHLAYSSKMLGCTEKGADYGRFANSSGFHDMVSAQCVSCEIDSL